MGRFQLSIDHVQGDPFAAPSKVSVFVSWDATGLDASWAEVSHRRIAVEDFLLRRFAQALRRVSRRVGGSGKSGIIATTEPGPEVYPRSACELVDDGVIARFEAGFPAHGRTVDGRGLEHMLCDLVPAAVREALMLDGAAIVGARAAADLADDQQALRQALAERNLVAFVADGAVLPRASGVSSRPLQGALPFEAPESLRVAIDLPHRGRVEGMGIPRGITLIVGGGYHGKSTLLKALQEGVYNHVAGDGRELVVCDETSVKVRAEDGRPVHAVDISPFISNLPDGRDTRSFSTADASGSTSQAAATMEALEAGTRVLLVDEDTSATNFMVRDALMEEVVAADREPITPFVERIADLRDERGVSTVMVVGSSGAFFPLADCVVQMDAYRARDVTERVREVCRAHGLAIGAPDSEQGGHEGEGSGGAAPLTDMRRGADARASEDSDEFATQSGFSGTNGRCFPCLGIISEARQRKTDGGRGRSQGCAGSEPRIRVRTRGRDGFSVGEGSVDAHLLEQLVDAEQAESLAQLVRVMGERNLLDGTRSLPEAIDAVWNEFWDGGWQVLTGNAPVACGMALPRPQELFACLNRWRA